MILFEEVNKIVNESIIKQKKTETVKLVDSLNRILAQDVISDVDMPPFDKSAMDGYACKKEDIKNELEVIEIIPAGKEPEKIIRHNQCSKIMTGAKIPKGADCVLMVEHTIETGKNKIKFTKEDTNSNICSKAEDVKSGQTVLTKGIRIQPKHIGTFASVGCTNPLVYKKLHVGIITTGDELVEPNLKPGLSQIRNSNAYQLITQVKNVGANPNYLGIVKDNEEETYNIICKALEKNDLVLLTGGVSMGDYDFVVDTLKKAGLKILFDSVAVQPGRPTTFGVAKGKACFGLPGNPVSSFVQFELLIKPYILKSMGYNYKPVTIKMPLGVDYKRKKSKRKSFIPVYINDKGMVMPVDYHGSAHIHSYVAAQGMISINIGETIIKKGEIVDVRQI